MPLKGLQWTLKLELYVEYRMPRAVCIDLGAGHDDTLCTAQAKSGIEYNRARTCTV